MIAFDDSKRAIEVFNKNPVNPVSDWVISHHFGEGYDPALPHRASGRVHLLDLLFGTQLYRFHPDHELAIIDRIRQNADRICVCLADLRENDLLVRPDHVVDVAMRLFDLILGSIGERPGNYDVFASKYIHWCTRIHFPIMDDKAAAALNHFCGVDGQAFHPRCPEYSKWVWACHKLVQSWSDSEWEELRAIDKGTLPPTYGLSNSRLRLLDKILWEIGRQLRP